MSVRRRAVAGSLFGASGIAVLLILGALTSLRGDSESTPNVTLVVVRSPVCPVEIFPPDPACAPAPVADVAVRVVGVDGLIGTPHTTVDGTIILALEPGTYAITPQPVEGFPSTAAAFELVVPNDGSLVRHTITYDTGIR